MFDRVGPAGLEPGRVLREAGEQRLGQPALEELVDADPFEPGRFGLVGLAAGRAIDGVDDARRRADQRQPFDHLRRRQRDVQRQPAAHRVAEPGAGAAIAGQSPGGGPQITAGRDVRRADLEAGRVEGRHQRGPRAARLGEAVQQDQPR